ncbi:hypothetical protein PoB_003816700 [Plakobranchus ocellatus]|uniref:Uncharacterized protein n=1 Tax=Plakobranchus ocellatus TaxID=259542 RepID=A0AAV4AWL4_9GAST|nr:hypothetical protein PoB_003816700 [Plakobranchus ocellatus]
MLAQHEVDLEVYVCKGGDPVSGHPTTSREQVDRSPVVAFPSQNHRDCRPSSNRRKTIVTTMGTSLVKLLACRTLSY